MAIRVNSGLEAQLNNAINDLHIMPTQNVAAISSALANEIETGQIQEGGQLAARINQLAGQNRAGVDDFHLGKIIDTASQVVGPQFNDIVGKYNQMSQQATDEANAVTQSTLTKGLDTAYGQAADFSRQQIDAQYAPQRQRAVAEEAALGRLRSGVSADPNSAIGKTDTQKSNALSSLLGNLSANRANDMAGYFSNAAQLNQQNTQFNKSLAQQQNQTGLSYLLGINNNILEGKKLEADQNANSWWRPMVPKVGVNLGLSPKG